MGLEQIGLQAIFDDKNFQQGIARYQQGINQASSATDRGAIIMSRLGSVASGALVIGIGAATTALAAFSAVAKIGIDAAMQQGEAIDKLGDMFGLSAKQANTWATAFTHFGVPVEEAAQQINFFTRGLSETFKVSEKGKVTLTPFGESLKKLGVSAYDAKGKLKTFDQIMPQIMDAFAKLPNGVNKSALAMDLFGARGGSKFLDFLSSGSKSLTDATKRVEEFGGMTDDQRDALEQFGFELNDTRDNLQKIWSQIGLQVLPVLRRFVDFINVRVLPAFSQWVREYSPRIIKSLQDFAGVVQKYVLPFVQRLVDAFQRGGLGGVFSQIVTEIQNAIPTIVRVLQTLGTRFWDWLTGNNGVLWQIPGKMLEFVMKLGDWFRDHKDEIAAKFEALKTNFWNWLTGKGGVIEQIGDKLGLLRDLIDAWFFKHGDEIWKTLDTWKTQFWNWITDSQSGVLVTVADKMGELATKIEEWATSDETKVRFQGIGKDLANDILDGMGNFFDNPTPGAENLLMRLYYTLSRAVRSVINAFSSLGGDLAGGLIGGLVGRILGPDAERSVTDALTTFVTTLQRILIGGPFWGLGVWLFEQIMGGFAQQWNAVFGQWGIMFPGSTHSHEIKHGSSTSGFGGYAQGGPVTQTGLALVHAGEFVIPAPNVSNSRVTNFNFSHNWPAAVPASSRQWTEQMVRTVTHQELTSILGKV